MKSPVISVIIPIFNAEKYLTQCLNSVIHQTIKDIEIICIDDGSADKSPEILKKFAEKDSRIKIIYQKNLFAGAARNNGIKAAAGKYLAFWDSDDYFEPNALETMLKKCEKENADLCLCAAYTFEDGSERRTIDETILKKRFLPKESVFSIKTHPEYIFNIAARAPWNKIIRADFIRENGIAFQNLQNSNDTYFSIICMYYAKRITYTTAPLIHYRVNNSESITGKAAADPLCTYKAYAAIYDEITKGGISDKAMQSFYSRLYNGLIRSIMIQETEESMLAAYKNVKDECFERFDIAAHLSADYCYFKSDFEDMMFISEHTLAEFLMYKYKKENRERLFYKSNAEKKLSVRLARKISLLLPANSKLFETGKRILHFR